MGKGELMDISFGIYSYYLSKAKMNNAMEIQTHPSDLIM